MAFSRLNNISDDSALIIPRPVKQALYYLLVPVLPISCRSISPSNSLKMQIDRRLKLEKYRKKRERRALSRQVRYKCRQEQASLRLRIKGKFCKSQKFSIMEESSNN